MALLLKRFYQGYSWVFDDMSDHRSDELGLFLMSSPIKPIVVVTAYIYFVYSLGPKLMANRKPFDLKIVLILYNLLQVLVNAYIVVVAFEEAWYYTNWDCAPVDYSSTPRLLYVLKMYHLFFIVKMIDLLDTVFFVLRKKNEQISFLHVYHHFAVFLMLWLAVKFFAGGSGVFTGLINSAVHTVMYTYYLLTAIDDKWKKSVTIKKTITKIQIIQFILLIIIYGRLLVKSDCSYPRFCSFLFVPQNIFMVLLFGDFYRRAYLSRNTGTGATKETFKNKKDISD